MSSLSLSSGFNAQGQERVRFPSEKRPSPGRTPIAGSPAGKGAAVGVAECYMPRRRQPTGQCPELPCTSTCKRTGTGKRFLPIFYSRTVWKYQKVNGKASGSKKSEQQILASFTVSPITKLLFIYFLLLLTSREWMSVLGNLLKVSYQEHHLERHPGKCSLISYRGPLVGASLVSANVYAY